MKYGYVTNVSKLYPLYFNSLSMKPLNGFNSIRFD